MNRLGQRCTVILGVVALAAMAAAVGLGLSHSSVAADGDNPLKDMLGKTNLKSRALDNESWVVPFDGKDGEGIDVYVTYNNEKRRFAMVFATAVDKEDKFDFDKDILLECMKLNNDYPACKFCLDYDHGDIDCQTEVLMSTLTPESLAMHINLIAAMVDEQKAELRKLVH